jgi:hypothetical protein
MSETKEAREPQPVHALFLGLMGSAGLGAIAGIDRGAFAVVHDAAVLPACIGIVTLVLVPALYIGSSMGGMEIRLQELGRAVLAGLRAAGVAALGLMAPMLFLLTSTTNPRVSEFLVSAVLLFVGSLGLWATYRRLYGPRPQSTGVATAYVLWALVFVGIGAKVSFKYLVI